MKAAYFVGDRRLELRDVPDPVPEPGEVVIEIKASGMCGSDLKFYRAPPGAGAALLGLGGDVKPVIAGHEPCGVVVGAGPGLSGREARMGQRVMNHHYKGCGVCDSCRVGWSQLCGEGFVVYGVTGDGAHAQYMKAPARTMVPLPDELSFEVGAALSCGTTTAYAALKRMGLAGDMTLAVFGQGPVGLSATLLAKVMGARLIAVEIGPERLAMARDMGADEVVDVAAGDTVERLHELTAGRGVEMAIECSGAPAARAMAVRSTRTWGTVCLVGEGGDIQLDVSRDVIRRQLTLLGSWTFSAVTQADCARFVAERGIPVERVFTHRYSLEQADEAYKLFDTQTTGKGVFVF